MRNPTIYKARDIDKWGEYALHEKKWIPARPLPFYGWRFMHSIKIAFFVLIGKYDALNWED